MPYKDPQKQKKAQHKHYINNKEKYREANRRARPGKKNRRLLWMREIKSVLKCKKCEESRPQCLDFHHRDPKNKEFTIGQNVNNHSKEQILKEIAKCDVLCKNCHANLHWEMRQ